MGIRIVSWSFIFFLAATFLSGQSGDQKPPSQPPSRPPGQAPSQDRPQLGRPTQPQQKPFRQLMLSGEIVLEEGGKLTEPVLVELKCNGRTVRQTHSSTNGGFFFHLDNQNPANMADASVGNFGFSGPGFSDGIFDSPFSNDSQGTFDDRVDLSACEISASVSGFRSSIIRLGIRRTLDKPDVGAILLSRMDSVAGSTVSLNTLAAPKKARDRYEKAIRELGKRKVDFAKTERYLQEAVEEFPEFAAAWNLLGNVRLGSDDSEGARQAFERAVEADPNYIPPYLSMAEMKLQAGEWRELSSLSLQVLELNENSPDAHYYYAVSAYSLGQHQLAEVSAQKIQSDPEADRFPGVHYLMGLILSKRGDFQSAAQHFERFISAAPENPAVAQVRESLEAWTKDGLITERKPSP